MNKICLTLALILSLCLPSYSQTDSTAKFKIALICHILHQGQAVGTGSNLSAAQVRSQLIVLNEDFNRQNPDTANTPAVFQNVAASMRVHFGLAKLDTAGKVLLEPGINRVQVPLESYKFNQIDSLKRALAWNPDQYLNIYVVKFGGTIQDIGGLSTLPSASTLANIPVSTFANKKDDGILIQPLAFGSNSTAEGNDFDLFPWPYGRGRVLTHEIGHYLGLRHIWGNGNCGVDDGVEDTPLAAGANIPADVGACNAVLNSCGAGTPDDLPDMYQNYMDYSGDHCFNLFTRGQRTRIWTVLTKAYQRQNLDANYFHLTTIGTERDSLILVDFYNAMAGSNWKQTWNLAQPLHTWHGVSLRAGRVTKLQLANNGVKGTFPANFRYLDSLEVLELQSNLLDTLPDLADLGLATFKVQDNYLGFESVEPNISKFDSTSYYNPQRTGTGRHYKRPVKSSLSLKVEVAGSGNTYQWYRNQSTIADANQATLTIDALTLADSGLYQCEIRNTRVPNLIIKSAVDTVEVYYTPSQLTALDSLVLVDFYAAMDGSNWRVDWNLRQPLNTWSGVRLRNYRVVELDLENNNLKGVLPLSLKNLDSLSRLNLAANRLDTLPDLAGLNIRSLEVQKNYLGLDDLEPNLSKLGASNTYSPQYLGSGRRYVGNQHSDFTFRLGNLGGSGHTYQWYHNNSLLAGETNSSLVLSSIQAGDTGSYHCKVGVNSGIIADLVMFSGRDTLSLNHTPTDISISKASIAEQESIGTAIGILSTTDPNGREDHIYSLTSGDTSKFALAGDTLKSAVVFDYELEKLFDLTIQTTDPGGLSYSKDFRIRVSNLNEPPLEINISDTLIAENKPANTLIGRLNTRDTDTRDSHIYTLTGGDVGSFSIFGNRLETITSLDFERQSSYTITITSQDWGGLQVSKTFTIRVTDVNEAPTTVQLSNTKIAENSPAGTVIGVLSSTDTDAGDSHTYTLSGSAADSFNLIGSNLVVAGKLDFETDTSHSISLTATDRGGLSLTKDFTIAILNVIESKSGLRRLDSLALVALYDSAGGSGWTQSWDLARRLETWQGVKLQDERVIGLDLSSNNLRGIVPKSMAKLLALEVLDLSDNHLDSLVALDSLPALKRFEIQNNHLGFNDLEPNLRLFGDSTAYYSPQAFENKSRQTFSMAPGDNTTFTLAPLDTNLLDQAGNRYQWYRNGRVLAGKVNQTLDLRGVERDLHDSIYECKITNTRVADLVLVSNQRTVVVGRGVFPTDSLALVALYNSTGGSDWKLQWDFSQPVKTWSGITVKGSRVKRIELPDNNMRGPLPNELRNLPLEYINLNDNFLTHLVLPGNLNQIYIRNNHFDFHDIRNYFGIWLHDGWGNWKFPFNSHINNVHQYAPQRPLRPGNYHKKFTATGDDTLKLELNKTVRGHSNHFGHTFNYNWIWWYFNSYGLHARGNWANWYHNNGRLGASDKVLKLESLKPEHEGFYAYRVRNQFNYAFRYETRWGGRSYTPSNWELKQTTGLVLASDVDTLVVETLAPAEYEILKELYAKTDGDNWTNSWDTLMTGSHKWYGVELTADKHHVKGLRLQNNNLKDSIPAALAGLDSLQVLQLQDNKLTYLADLSGLDSLKDFQIQRNHLHFDDIRPNLALFVDSNAYSPQWLRDGKRYPTLLDDSVGLAVQVRGSGNRYQWLQHDTIPLVRRATLNLNPIEARHQGRYYCAVRHGTVPGLVLRSKYDTIEVKPFSEYDSLALVALYDSTGGPDWTHAWDLGQPVTTWQGIRTQRGRVRGIRLAANNLVGKLPPQIQTLELDTFEVQENQLRNLHLPNLRPNYSLNVAANNFDFGDLEPQASKFDSSGQYSPQGLLRAGTYYERKLGAALTLTVEARGSANRYQWFLNGKPQTGATRDSLALSNIQTQHTGYYFCQVSNSNLPGLVLKSGLDTLVTGSLQSDSLALVALYQQTAGENWRKSWDLNTPVSTWQGIRLVRGRVSAIDLADNGLRGSVPADLNQLTRLETLHLQTNQLDSLGNLTSLNHLTSFKIDSNRLGRRPIAQHLGLFKSADAYSPQFVGSGKTYHKALGSSLELQAEMGESDASYQWFLDGKALSGKTAARLRVDSLELLDVGRYHYTVQHASLPTLTHISSPDTVTITERSIDSLALVALYKSTGGPNWRVKWNLNQPINTWYGVRIKGGRVHELRLFTQNLKGELPPELGYLEKLTILELSDNELTGKLPASIGRLKNLHTLNIFENKLSGALPAELGNLDKLITLDIADNQFSGELAPAIPRLRRLTTLYFMNNDFSGPIPPAIGQLINLVRVDGENNRLSGTIPPEIGNLVNLENLFLCHNELTGSIPPEVGKLTNLQIMYLCDNELSDSIPATLGNLINLVKLNLAGNNLEGALPDSISNLKSLTHLWVSDNELDSVPDLSDLTSLVSVKIANNRLDFDDVAEVVADLGEDVVDAGGSSDVKMTIRKGKLYVRPYGGTLILAVNVRGAGNWYQWFFNDEELDGETSSSLTISPVAVGDTGLYHCEVINAKVGNMVLSSLPDTLKLLPLSLDSLALVDLYHATAGRTWRSGWDFTKPLETWQGVSVAGRRELRLTGARVVGLNLKAAGLRGSLPASLAVLSALEYVNLSANPALTGLERLNTLLNLQYLALTHNNLTDLGGLNLRNFGNLERLDLSYNGFRTPPAGLVSLDSLKQLWFTDNELETFPTLTHLRRLNDLKIAHNRLDFEAVRPNLGILGDSLNYSPQRIGYGQTYYQAPATRLTLQANSVRGTGQRYQWYYNDQPRPTATPEYLILDGVDFSDRGVYRYEVRHPDRVPGLVLRSLPDTLVVVGTVAEADSSALVSFYYSTLGSAWLQSWNLATPVTTWQGVKVAKGRVVALELPRNRLDGFVPASLNSLTGLTRLDLQGNYLSGLPNTWDSLRSLTYLSLADNTLSDSVPSSLSRLTNLETLHLAGNRLRSLPDLSGLSVLADLKVGDNAFQFGDLEPNLGFLSGDSSRYAPQTFSPTWSHAVEPASRLSLRAGVRGTFNTYRWYYGGRELVGETDSLLELARLGLEAAGTYSCVIRNSKVPQLEYRATHFVSVLRTVPVQDSLALVALYHSTHGSGWKDGWDLKRPISHWQGVTHRGGRVVKLDLAKRGLSGKVPANVNALTALDTFYLQHNRLQDLADFSALPALKLLKVNANYLDFEDVKPHLVQLQQQDSNYHPQTIRAGRRYEKAVGNSFELAVVVEGGGQTYQWYHNGTALAGATHSRLSLTNLKQKQAGYYHCEVRNVLIPDLVLASLPDTLLLTRTVSLSDSLALVAFYRATDGSNWRRAWNLNDPVKSWFGVQVDSGRVHALVLESNNLKGTLPTATSLLTALRVLKLSDNQLGGALPDLQALAQLTTLQLDSNEFSSVSGLPAVRRLRLQNNRLHFADLEPHLAALGNNAVNYSPQAVLRSGKTYYRNQVPEGKLRVQVRGIALSYQWYHNEQLVSGSNSSELKLLIQQQAADSYFCVVRSAKVPDLVLRSLPDTVHLVGTAVPTDSLILVDFYQQTGGASWTKSWDLSKPIKTWAGVVVKVGKVQALRLPANNLTGTLPARLGDLDQLASLELPNNRLTGSIPLEFYDLELASLDLARNNLSGSLHRDLHKLKHLEHLNLAGNRLGGVLPATIAYLASLKTLNLGSNQFGGVLPAALGALQNLETLDLGANNLRGSLPAGLGSLAKLRQLSLDSNRLTGELPSSLGSLKALATLTLQQNSFAGLLPNSLGSLTKLKHLDLAGNQFRGTLPANLFGLSDLEHLDLGSNDFSGVLPAGLGTLSKLTYLSLHHNAFEGVLPADLGDLANLETLYLQNNKLSGLPSWTWWKLLGLRDFRVQHNYLTAADLKPNLHRFGRVSGRYSPQLIRLGSGYEREVGEGLDLSVVVSGSGNVYQWYFGERVLAGAVAAQLRLRDLGLAQSGLYQCRVGNVGVPGLVMQSLPDTLEVTNVGPTGLVLSGDSILENLPGGSLIGVLGTVDGNRLDRHSYILGGVDARHFKIAGDRLLSAYYFDYESRSVYEIAVRSVDRGGLSVSKTFKVRIIDVLDGNQVLLGSGDSAEEVDSAGSGVGLGDLGALGDSSASVSISIYPNPSSGILRIRGLAGVESLEVRVLSVSGAVVGVYKTIQQSYDLSHLAKGIYFIIVAKDGQVTTHKLILE